MSANPTTVGSFLDDLFSTVEVGNVTHPSLWLRGVHPTGAYHPQAHAFPVLWPHGRQEAIDWIVRANDFHQLDVCLASALRDPKLPNIGDGFHYFSHSIDAGAASAPSSPQPSRVVDVGGGNSQIHWLLSGLSGGDLATDRIALLRASVSPAAPDHAPDEFWIRIPSLTNFSVTGHPTISISATHAVTYDPRGSWA